MKKHISVLLLFAVLWGCMAGVLSGCGQAKNDRTPTESSYTTLNDLDSEEYRLVVETGSACALAGMEVFPETEIVYGNMAADCFKMVQDGKADGHICERVTYEKAVRGNVALAGDLTVLNGKIGTIDIAAGFPKGPLMGQCLGALLDRVIDETLPNERGALLDAAVRWLNEQH